MSKSNEDVEPILGGTLDQRLAAIARRHGGNPKSAESIAGKIILPPVKRGLSKDQMALFEDEK